MNEIFQPHEECEQPKKVLIEGNPGMGKTTYCNKIAYDWATKKHKAEDCFTEFWVVLLLKCRDVEMESDLWGAIDDQLLPGEIHRKEREKFFDFIRQNQSKVLLILDGLDELPSSKLPEFTDIIQGKILPLCIGVRARCDLGGRRPVCPKKLRSAPLLDCRNQLFTPSKCTKKHAFTIVERHKIVRNRNTVFRTSHTLCRFTRCSNDRVTKQATRSSN